MVCCCVCVCVRCVLCMYVADRVVVLFRLVSFVGLLFCVVRAVVLFYYVEMWLAWFGVARVPFARCCVRLSVLL